MVFALYLASKVFRSLLSRLHGLDLWLYMGKSSELFLQLRLGMTSVVTAQADVFAILGNKIVKNLKIFVEVDYLRSRGVLCQP